MHISHFGHKFNILHTDCLCVRVCVCVLPCFLVFAVLLNLGRRDVPSVGCCFVTTSMISAGIVLSCHLYLNTRYTLLPVHYLFRAVQESTGHSCLCFSQNSSVTVSATVQQFPENKLDLCLNVSLSLTPTVPQWEREDEMGAALE